MSNTLPIALTGLSEYISAINSVRIYLTHMLTMLRVGSLKTFDYVKLDATPFKLE